MRAPVKRQHRQFGDGEHFERGAGHHHQVTLTRRAFRLIPCRLGQLLSKQYHIWLEDTIAIWALWDFSRLDVRLHEEGSGILPKAVRAGHGSQGAMQFDNILRASLL